MKLAQIAQVRWVFLPTMDFIYLENHSTRNSDRYKEEILNHRGLERGQTVLSREAKEEG
jgi:hypothetical protein